MSTIGYTPGGSPIFAPNLGGNRLQSRKGKQLNVCSADERHKLTNNQAASNGYMCSHCGAELKVRKNKLIELHTLAKELGLTIAGDVK
jgi:transcription initiation factor IIE alpha subunit